VKGFDRASRRERVMAVGQVVGSHLVALAAPIEDLGRLWTSHHNTIRSRERLTASEATPHGDSQRGKARTLTGSPARADQAGKRILLEATGMTAVDALLETGALGALGAGIGE
jgi:hypothetical protein